MARLALALFRFLSSTSILIATVAASPQYNQEEQNRNAECDNDCFFGSFPGGSCTNDAACMCTQQKYREAYFCCMAEKCAASVLPDSIVRQTSECEARNMPFTFDAEAVCGIKLTTASSSTVVPVGPTPTPTGDSGSSSAAAATTTSTSAASSTTALPESQTSSSGASTPAPTTNGAPRWGAMLWNGGVVILVAASGLVLL